MSLNISVSAKISAGRIYIGIDIGIGWTHIGPTLVVLCCVFHVSKLYFQAWLSVVTNVNSPMLI
jgi:hypothetical protein